MKPLVSPTWSRSNGDSLAVIVVACVALAATALLTCTNIEERVCRRRPAGPTPPQVATKASLVLYAGCASLWIGTTLALASPTLAYLFYDFSNGAGDSYAFADLFTYATCGQEICYRFLLRQYVAHIPRAVSFANAASAFAVLTYLICGVFLLPAAAMLSLACYRVSALTRFGAQPYDPGSGWSLSNLAIAKLVATTGATCLAAVYVGVLILCSKVISDHSADIVGRNNTISMATQPGVVSMGLATVLAFAGAALATVAALGLRDVEGVGGPPVVCAGRATAPFAAVAGAPPLAATTSSGAERLNRIERIINPTAHVGIPISAGASAKSADYAS